MSRPAVDTLNLVKSLDQAGMPNPQAEALAAIAGSAPLLMLFFRWQIARRLKRAGLTPRAAKALARVLRARIPRGAAFLDTLIRAHGLENGGLAPSHAEVLLGFLQPARPLRRPFKLFASHRAARALETAGIAGPAAGAIAASLFRARKRGTPVDSLTAARTLQNLGMTGPAAEAIAGLLAHMVLDDDPVTTAATLSAAGIARDDAHAIFKALHDPLFASRLIDTLPLMKDLRKAGMADGKAGAIADAVFTATSRVLGAQVTTLALARDLSRAGLPAPQAEAIARHLYRGRYWPIRLAMPVARAARTFEAAGFSAAEARVLAKGLRVRASRPAPEDFLELFIRPSEILLGPLFARYFPE